MSGEGSAAAGLAGGGAKDGWVTPELIQKIMASPILRKAFTDPRCAAAMEQLQKDPAGAMRTHGAAASPSGEAESRQKRSVSRRAARSYSAPTPAPTGPAPMLQSAVSYTHLTLPTKA